MVIFIKYYYGNTIGDFMKTVPTKLTPKLLSELDKTVEEGWYASRSEAIRDAVRELVEKMKLDKIERNMREDIEWGLHGKD